MYVKTHPVGYSLKKFKSTKERKIKKSDKKRLMSERAIEEIKKIRL